MTTRNIHQVARTSGDVGFHVTRLRRTAVTFQLNVQNLLDEDDPIVRRRRTVIVAPDTPVPSSESATPTSYFLRTPRSWTLTSKFDF